MNSKSMPRNTTKATGMMLTSGSFVEIAGMYCKMPLMMKKSLMALVNWFKREIGRNEIRVYLVDFTLFDANY